MDTACLIIGMSSFACLALTLIMTDGLVLISFILGIIGILLGFNAPHGLKKRVGLIMSIITVVFDTVIYIFLIAMISINGFGIN